MSERIPVLAPAIETAAAIESRELPPDPLARKLPLEQSRRS